ncbi:MAG: ABC transporter substrate-binding protein [Burkholderiaceae bacterium]
MGATGPMSGRGSALRRALAMAGALCLAVCVGGGAMARDGSPPGAAIEVVDDRGRSIRLAAPARRTETVCALDACDRLVGVDRSSNWPLSIALLPRLGGMEDTVIERVVALRPDLVLAAASTRAVERMESLGLTVVALEPKGYADTRRVIGVVAQLVGRDAEGAAVWAGIEARIEAAARRVPASMRGTRVYVEVSDAPHAAGEASFIGETLRRLGLGNIVPASLGPFPQLNPEFVVRAAPELIIASERGLASIRTRPGWADVPAVRTHRLCGFDGPRYDTLVRPGPRLGEAAELLADCTARGTGGPAR